MPLGPFEPVRTITTLEFIYFSVRRALQRPQAARFLYVGRFHICMETIQPLESTGVRQNPYRRPRRTKRYERFGEVIRYLTADELQQFFDSIDNYTHKLMFEVIYELGCRVGEFVRIQVQHVSFSRSTVFFPAENTKTKTARTSSLPQGLTNETQEHAQAKGDHRQA